MSIYSEFMDIMEKTRQMSRELDMPDPYDDPLRWMTDEELDSLFYEEACRYAAPFTTPLWT